MVIALSITLFVLSVILHELAHALSMKGNGIRLQAFGIGLPFRPIFSFGKEAFRMEISPWLAGAYVRPLKEDLPKLDTLSHKEQSWIDGSGVVLNTLIGVGCLIVINSQKGDWLSAGLSVAAFILVWLVRKHLCAYVIPALSFPALVLIGYGFIRTLGEPVGVVATAKLIASPNDFREVLILAMLVNFGLAIINIIPLSMTDGGHIVGRILKARLSDRYYRIWRKSGFYIVWGLTVYALFSDLIPALD